MNRNKTAQLLNEWKTFLSEGKDPTFSEDDIGIKVKISTCCEYCETYFKEKDLSKHIDKSGVLSGHDMNNRDEFKDGKENFVLVMLDGKEKEEKREKVQFPQCCVKRKSDDK